MLSVEYVAYSVERVAYRQERKNTMYRPTRSRSTACWVAQQSVWRAGWLQLFIVGDRHLADAARNER